MASCKPWLSVASFWLPVTFCFAQFSLDTETLQWSEMFNPVPQKEQGAASSHEQHQHCYTQSTNNMDVTVNISQRLWFEKRWKELCDGGKGQAQEIYWSLSHWPWSTPTNWAGMLLHGQWQLKGAQKMSIGSNPFQETHCIYSDTVGVWGVWFAIKLTFQNTSSQ